MGDHRPSVILPVWDPPEPEPEAPPVSAIVQRRYEAFMDFKTYIEEETKRHSLRQIAQRTGLNHSTVSRIRTGTRAANMDTAKRIIEAFIK